MPRSSPHANQIGGDRRSLVSSMSNLGYITMASGYSRRGSGTMLGAPLPRGSPSAASAASGLSRSAPTILPDIDSMASSSRRASARSAAPGSTASFDPRHAAHAAASCSGSRYAPQRTQASGSAYAASRALSGYRVEGGNSGGTTAPSSSRTQYARSGGPHHNRGQSHEPRRRLSGLSISATTTSANTLTVTETETPQGQQVVVRVEKK